MSDAAYGKNVLAENIRENIARKTSFIDNVYYFGQTPLFSWLDINITELCNRKCVFCPRSEDGGYPNQSLFLSLELAKKLAKELRAIEYQGGVVFSGYGEPLLHPNIVELVGIFKDVRHLEIVTNGDKLSVALIKSLYDAGLAYMVVSMYDGEHQIESFKAMFADAGISEDNYFLRDRWHTQEDGFGLKLTNRAGMVSVGKQDKVDTKRACYYTHYSMMIDWNGDVMLCVQDWNKKVKFGNLYAQSLLDVWQSQSINKYRKLLGSGQRVLAPCSQCNTSGTFHGFNHRAEFAKINSAKYNKHDTGSNDYEEN